MHPPAADSYLDHLASLVHRLRDLVPHLNIWTMGLAAGLVVLGLALVIALRRLFHLWVPLTGRVLECSVEVMPGLFRRNRKIALITHVVSFEFNGEQREGVCTTRDTRDLYFDARRYVRRVIGEEVQVYLRNGTTSDLRMDEPPKILDRRLLLIAGVLGLVCVVPALQSGATDAGRAATPSSYSPEARNRSTRPDASHSQELTTAALKPGSDPEMRRENHPVIVQH